MIKSIVSKFLIALIILFTSLSVFWFFKTSSIKKQASALISSSGGLVSASSISVAGFPLEQKLSINDLKIQPSAPNTTPSVIDSFLLNNKYQIQIKKLEASASIFSSGFIISKFEEVSFQDQNGVVSSLEFNQTPKATFLVDKGELVKFSYSDNGYKVIDAGKNVLFENGNSTIEFESTTKDNKYYNKVKADFKDVEAFIPANSVASIDPIATDGNLESNDVVENPDVKAGGVAKIEEPNLTNTATTKADEIARQSESNQIENVKLAKKNIFLEMEYVINKSSANPTPNPTPAPTPDLQNTVSSDIAPINERIIESVYIKNFEITSPSYKINVNGEISSFPKNAMPIGGLSVRVEKLDNILIYIKKYAANISNTNNINKNNNLNGDISNTGLNATSESATTPSANQKPEIDFLAAIKDLAKKNAASNEEISVFDFRQEQGKDLLINEIPFLELVSQIFVSQPQAADQSGAMNPDSSSVNINAKDQAPIPNPAKINIPAKSKNAN